MKTPSTQNSKLPIPQRHPLTEALTIGTNVNAPNEYAVRVDVLELEPFVKVKRPSRSSTVYDRVE